MCNEGASLCTNYQVLKRDYGQVLFERDLARKNLQIASFRLGDGSTLHNNVGSNGAAGISTEEKKMRDEHKSLEKAHLKRSSKSSNSKRQLRQDWNNHSKFDCETDLSSGWFVKGSGNGDDDDDDDDDDDGDNEDVNEDRNYVLNWNSNTNAECDASYMSEFGPSDFEFDVDDNEDTDGSSDDADHDDNNDGGQHYDNTIENDDDYAKDGDCGGSGSDVHHHPHRHYALPEPCDGGGGDTEFNRNDDRDNEKDDGHPNHLICDGNYDNEDDAVTKEANDLVIQVGSLTVDNIMSGRIVKDAKLATKDSTVSLPVNSGLDDKVDISQTTAKTAVINSTGNKKQLGETTKALLTNNVNTSMGPVTGHSLTPSKRTRPKTLSTSLPRGNWGEPDNLYKSRIPSLEATGINQNFLARHTTDKSLQHALQPGNYNLPKKSTSRNDWPVWSLPPLVSETCNLKHRWPETRGLHPSIVDQQTAAQSNWQFWNQPWQDITYSNFASQEHKSFSHVDPWFARGEEAYARPRPYESLPDSTDTEVDDSFNMHAWMPNAYKSNSCFSASNFDGSQANSSTYVVSRDELPSRLTAVKSRAPVILPTVTTPDTGLQSTGITSWDIPSYSYSSNASLRNGQERSADPFKFFTENQDARPSISSEVLTASRVEDQTTGDNMSQEALLPGCSQIGLPATDSTDDLSLAALERKVAEACAIVENVMREREERTKAQREEARKRRERREKREREDREKREREEREGREREERERRKREEREERERREQIENEDRETRRFVGERAPVQESPGWQCQHYQRRCRVKFSCCSIFYPCHRCHNISGACDTDDRKANNATHVKCGNCGHEEEINEGSQYCSGCGERMSAYFCYICKHFTGVEKNPFHCDKCGICRIHRDKSFHCDVCNVCLDKRLEGKHKCRPDSGHDECCICLEDAFSGCQILPCSHKVHKDCAIAMIQNGVRNCPICRHPLFNQESQ